MKRAIVTGANGFIGYQLVKRLLKNDYCVYAVVKENAKNISFPTGIEVIYCAIDHYDKLASRICDSVNVFYHLAWEGVNGCERANHKTQIKNAAGVLLAAEAAKKLNSGKFISTGTITENLAEEVIEKNLSSQNMMYAVTKNYAHNMLNIWSQNNGLNYVWAQLANVFGEGNRTGNLLGYTITSLCKKERPTYSAGLQIYDFIYISDCVEALYLLGEAQTPQTSYFIGSGVPRQLKDYILTVRDMIDPRLPVGLGERCEDHIKYNPLWFNITQLCKDTGYSPQYSFEQAIRKVIDYECDLIGKLQIQDFASLQK